MFQLSTYCFYGIKQERTQKAKRNIKKGSYDVHQRNKGKSGGGKQLHCCSVQICIR
jgi:hypothetical protein